MKIPALVLGAILLLSVSIPAGARDLAPSFMAKTLGGQTYTSENLRGENILVEFWATWCQVCRDDQAAVDSISRRFSGRGLIVLAVDSYESGGEVRQYLAQHPRSCNVVLNEDTDLVSRFQPASFPYYVLINGSGEIAGTQDGGGGEGALLDLLGNVGLGGSSRYPSEEAPRPALRHSEPRLIEVSQKGFPAHPKPMAPAVFILKSGEKLETRHYTITAGKIEITDGTHPRTFPVADLNRPATLAANKKRGINLRIPANENDVYLGF